MSYLYILGTILCTVYGQLIIKWKMSQAGTLPETFVAKSTFLISMVLNPWVLSSFAAAFFAALCWMAAMTKFELSFAYPFMSLSFVLVLVFSGFIFQEAITLPKVVGMTFIVLGIVIGSQG
jgi:multidrug transporter EmrE-like cation transporter